SGADTTPVPSKPADATLIKAVCVAAFAAEGAAAMGAPGPLVGETGAAVLGKDGAGRASATAFLAAFSTRSQATRTRGEREWRSAQRSAAIAGRSNSIKSGTKWLDPNPSMKASASCSFCVLTARWKASISDIVSAPAPAPKANNAAAVAPSG